MSALERFHCTQFFTYRISSYKLPRRIFNFDTWSCGAHWNAVFKRGGCLFQSKNSNNMDNLDYMDTCYTYMDNCFLLNYREKLLLWHKILHITKLLFIFVVSLFLSFNYNTYNYTSMFKLMIQRLAQFLEKGLRILSQPHFVYDFSRKMFLMLYSINRTNFIDWLSLLLGIFGNMGIPIVSQVVTS